MGLYGNLHISASQSLAISNESLYFFEGVIQSENDSSALVFLGTAQALNASHQSTGCAIGTKTATRKLTQSQAYRL